MIGVDKDGVAMDTDGWHVPTDSELLEHLNQHLGEHERRLVALEMNEEVVFYLLDKVDELETNLAAVVRQLAMVSMNQFLQHIADVEGGEYVEDTELHDWGMAFVSKVDAVVQKPGNESLKEEWMEGEWSNDIVRLCREVESDITEEQLEWVEGFLSEI